MEVVKARREAKDLRNAYLGRWEATQYSGQCRIALKIVRTTARGSIKPTGFDDTDW